MEMVALITDPTKDPEPACIALQIGMYLLMSPGGAAPADDVTLCVQTSGVELINPDNNIHTRANPKPACATPNGVKTASLQGLLNGFESMCGKVVICTLCTMSRGITQLTNGIFANPVIIHNLFLSADKVMTF
ncbi:MAG: hypothetical protein DIZ80_04560 [endosymbiont of Galathealinum brachiosum]|uniref:Sulfur reduction protein DsrE n=1 Tax=endosymbiont of Galathealinum brachiosum TaxID=2200906 RepID=A0A370DK34_9GAMM|nr:MAG: hypothetical protein DIZ80_04560 [endosymbiont of Galathealinum brachiosum]